MTASFVHRLSKLEKVTALPTGDVDRLSDDQLWRVLRSCYPAMKRKHGSLSQAVAHLRATNDPEKRALVTLIQEDIDGGRA